MCPVCVLGGGMGVGRPELWGRGVPSSLEFLPGMGLGGSISFVIYFLRGGHGAGGGGGVFDKMVILILPELDMTTTPPE